MKIARTITRSSKLNPLRVSTIFQENQEPPVHDHKNELIRSRQEYTTFRHREFGGELRKVRSTKRSATAANQRSAEDPRLVRLTEICLALPETTRQISGPHASFLVRKRTFAYFL